MVAGEVLESLLCLWNREPTETEVRLDQLRSGGRAASIPSDREIRRALARGGGCYFLAGKKNPLSTRTPTSQRWAGCLDPLSPRPACQVVCQGPGGWVCGGWICGATDVQAVAEWAGCWMCRSGRIWRGAGWGGGRC
jgi:hypothetical protein